MPRLTDEYVDNAKWSAMIGVTGAQQSLLDAIKTYGPISREALTARTSLEEAWRIFRKWAKVK